MPLSPKPTVLIVATHPIQYQVPWFQSLAQRQEIHLKVLYLSIPDAQAQGLGFGLAFQWDIPLLEGYDWQLAKGLQHHSGRGGFWASSLSSPINELKSIQPDVVILTGWQTWPLLQLLWACGWLKIPRIVRGESNGLKPRPVWVRWLHRLLLHQYDAFLVIGQANAQFYRNHGIAPSKLIDCRYFVDNQRFAAAAAALRVQRSQLRQAWQISPEAVCFCYVGKLEPKKRLLDLLTAFQVLTDRSPGQRAHLLVVGSGELMTTAQAFVASHQLPVTFAGFLNQGEIVQAYVAADCLVLPSDYGETWGLVVNEGMACGLPAIVSDRVGCGPDLIEEGLTGHTFEFANIGQLADLLESLSVNPQRLLTMGRAAQARVLQDYSVNRAVAGTLKAVEGLMYAE